MKYNPLNSVFKEGNVLLKVVRCKNNGASCRGCWYNGYSDNKRNYPYHCFIHGHVCTPTNRKDKAQVIFQKVD